MQTVMINDDNSFCIYAFICSRYISPIIMRKWALWSQDMGFKNDWNHGCSLLLCRRHYSSLLYLASFRAWHIRHCIEAQRLQRAACCTAGFVSACLWGRKLEFQHSFIFISAGCAQASICVLKMDSFPKGTSSFIAFCYHKGFIISIWSCLCVHAQTAVTHTELHEVTLETAAVLLFPRNMRSIFFTFKGSIFLGCSIS